MIRMTSIKETDYDKVLMATHIRCIYMHIVQQQDMWFSSPHSHQYVELCYVSKGTGLYNIDDVEYSMDEGDLFILPKGATHAEQYVKDAPYELFFFMVEHTGEGAGRLESLLFSESRRIEFEEVKIHTLFDKIVNELVGRKEGYLSCVESLLKEIYIDIIRKLFTGSSKDSQKAVAGHFDIPKQLRQIMEIDGGMALTPAEIAERMHYSSKYLSMLLNRKTGMSLYSFQNHIRLENACDLLTNTNHTIADIIELCGFQNAAHFFRLFKSTYGITPAKYRKRIKTAPQDELIKL